MVASGWARLAPDAGAKATPTARTTIAETASHAICRVTVDPFSAGLGGMLDERRLRARGGASPRIMRVDETCRWQGRPDADSAGSDAAEVRRFMRKAVCSTEPTPPVREAIAGMIVPPPSASRTVDTGTA